MSRRRIRFAWLWIFSISGCTQHLASQPRYHSQGQSSYFTDQRANRPQVEGTIPHATPEAPIEWSKADFERGRERYAISCSVCHDLEGGGNGPVVDRGFERPKSFDYPSQRALSDQKIFEVIGNGSGSMPGFRFLISERDRRLIVGYVRILQLRNHIPHAWLSESDLRKLGGTAEFSARGSP